MWVSLGQNQRVTRTAFPLEALGEDLLSCLYQLLEASCILWLLGPFHFQSQEGPVDLSDDDIPLVLTLPPPSSSFKETCVYIGPTQIIQDNVCISRST